MGSGPHYEMRFFFDYGADSCLWASNDFARDRWGYNVDRSPGFPLSDASWSRVAELCDWYETSLNWEDPSGPGPWRQEECDRFNAAAGELLQRVRDELGPDFVVVDAFDPVREDPRLDR